MATEMRCEKCRAVLGFVNGVDSSGAVIMSTFVCECGRGVTTHYSQGVTTYYDIARDRRNDDVALRMYDTVSEYRAKYNRSFTGLVELSVHDIRRISGESGFEVGQIGTLLGIPVKATDRPVGTFALDLSADV